MTPIRSTAGAGRRALIGRRLRLAATSALAGSLTLAIGVGASAAPTGGVIAAGGATIGGQPGDMTIQQSTQNAVINWQGFNIGKGEAVTFVQPNAQSVALNRVLGADPSVILGRLSANGRVFLTNPNGVLFGADAQVNVGGLVASTLKIGDADLMAGRYSFSGAGPGSVVNQGAILADGGSVVLMGAQVSNQGLISARLGAVSLAAGNAITLDVAGDGLLKVTIDEASLAALAENGGVIRADGGSVTMSARSASALLRGAVNNTGLIAAQSLETRNGVVSLLGGDVQVSGAIDVSGAKAGETGGRIVVTGDTVALTDGARLDASGQAGGGAVLVGGGYQGKDAMVANALTTDMGRGAVITADALSSGSGGQVVLWSQGRTRVAGAVSARGGALSGDGGLVETSGHTVSTQGLRVDTLAPQGRTGLWLLDPVNYTISAGGVDESGASVGLSLATTDRLIVADNDIVVSDVISWSSAHTLELRAGHDVTISSAINASGVGSVLRVVAGNDITASGPITDSSANALIQFTAGHTLTVSGAMTADAAGALIDLNAGGNIVQSATISASAPGFPGAGAASVVMRADNDGTGGAAGGAAIISAALTADNLSIYYSPQLGYAAPNAYSAQAGVTVHGTYVGKMWVFAGAADKVYDANTAATLAFRNGDPTVGGTVAVALGGTGAFADANVGANKAVNLSGAGLSGGGATAYALFSGGGATTASITPAKLTVTANSATKTYGQVVVLPGPAFTAVGLVGGQTISAVTLASAGLAASATVAGGPYAITPSNAVGGFSPGNYAITYVAGVLTVVPAVLTIKANDATKTYGQAVAFTGGEFTAWGLLDGETVSSVTLTSAGSVAGATVLGGPYAIVASGAAGAYTPANYTISYVAGVLTVRPASLVVTANDTTKPFGTSRTFTGLEFTTSGLQNGETAGSATLTSDGAGSTAMPTNATYAIVASNLTGGTFTPANYATTYVDGALTVSAPSAVADAGAQALAQTNTIRGASPTPTGLTSGPDGEDGGAFAPAASGGGSYGQVNGPAGVRLAVLGEGVRMPAGAEAVLSAGPQGQADMAQPDRSTRDARAPAAAQATQPGPAPAAYVAPRYVRKQDRN